MGEYQDVKKLVRGYFEELEKCKTEEIKSVLSKYMSKDYTWEGVYPFLDQSGSDTVAEVFWTPLKETLTHMQRRQDVFIAGTDKLGKTWVMSMGQFMGLFDREILGIRPTGKMQHLQYAEYTCVENGKIVHTAMFIDLLGFMKQAGAYPLPPETGNYFVYPGPRDHNGLLFDDAPKEQGEKSLKIVEDMIDDLISLNVGNETPKELLEKSWADDMIWYGPCGIGASYTIPRYQKQHQIPFRKQLIDKKTNDINAYFAEGDFVCFYTSMEVTPTGGWLGMTEGKKEATLRGDIDIYYCKDGKISENWCFIDLPFWLNEQGVDIFKRTADILNPKI